MRAGIERFLLVKESRASVDTILSASKAVTHWMRFLHGFASTCRQFLFPSRSDSVCLISGED